MISIKRLIDAILTPSQRDEDGYTWAVVGIGHVMLGAALQGLLGWSGAALRVLIAVGYWLAKERGDIRRGGALRDGLVDAAFVGVGAFYSGPRWWPLAVMATVCVGAAIREAGRTSQRP